MGKLEDTFYWLVGVTYTILVISYFFLYCFFIDYRGPPSKEERERRRLEQLEENARQKAEIDKHNKELMDTGRIIVNRIRGG